ncbi:MAG: hypothetical protein LBD05_03010 [Mycoplasmataceae bacterium]|nr:hypothetical protein [Mycoplasmataceae bacterium]
MSANINKSSKKLTLIISMIALMVVSVVIVLIILFSCKNQKSISIESSDGTSATEITIPLNQEQSKTYVGKYNNEVLSDCEWSYIEEGTTSVIDGLSIDSTTGILSWVSSFSSIPDTSSIIISCEKEGYTTGTLTVTITIDNQIVIDGAISIDVEFSTTSSEQYDASFGGTPLDNVIWNIVNNGGLQDLTIDDYGFLTWTLFTTTIEANTYTIEISCAKSPYTTGTYSIDFNVGAAPYDSWFIDTNDVLHELPYEQDYVTALCNINGSGTFVPPNFYGKLKGIHFGSEWDGFTSAPDNFCRRLFTNSTLVKLMTINLPKNLITVGNYFCSSVFEWAMNLKSLPPKFNLPVNITTVGDNFCSAMFYTTLALESLSFGFNLPAGIETIGSNFCYQMFQSCGQLKYGFEDPDTILHTPDVAGYSLMFASCTILNANPANFPNDAIPNTDYSIFRS